MGAKKLAEALMILSANWPEFRQGMDYEVGPVGIQGAWIALKEYAAEEKAWAAAEKEREETCGIPVCRMCGKARE